jgi:type II secretory pathway pseudopilin PulG
VKRTAEKSSTGWIIGGFILVICIIAAVLLPDFWKVVLRKRQETTYAEIQSIGKALEAYRSARGFYPSVSSIQGLAPELEPTYIKVLPTLDMWQGVLRYQAWKENPRSPGPDAYGIASAGKDHLWENPDLREYKKKTITQFKNDIVYRSGRFVRQMGGAAD